MNQIITPSRICLFGEHQDYLGLPVIPMAISLYSRIQGERKKEAENWVTIHKLDLNETETFPLDELNYTRSRDYFKSGIKVCLDEGLQFSSGIEAEVTSDIPFQAGCSSSSSIMVGWIHFLSQMADKPINWQPDKIAELAYKAEVLEFGEPGGMMDQYSTAMGGLIYLESEPDILVRSLNPELGSFVLGDSCEPKDTMRILQHCRETRLNIMHKLRHQYQEFSIYSCEIDLDLSCLNPEEKKLFSGTIRNRDLLKQGMYELEKDEPNHEVLGQLFTEHHAVLRDILNISTAKIESMLNAALKAGAHGGKINGSGGGGSMFAYAPDNPGKVVDSIEKAGGKAYIVSLDEGTRIEPG